MGWGHACAIDDGFVVCWGDTSLGLVGDRDERIARPARVEGLSSIVEVAVGQLLSCALDAGGRVHCWGNAVGTRTPRLVDALPRAERIFTGSASVCVLTPDATVACTGLSFFSGACASPTADLDFDFVSEPAVSDVVEIGVGWRHTCALRADGAVFCWGCADRFETGTRESRSHRDPIRVEDVSGDQLAAGSHATCAVAGGRGVTCWGEGSQFGTSVTIRPTPPREVSFGFEPAMLDVGVLMTCAARGDQIGCIGASFDLPSCGDRGAAPQAFTLPDVSEIAVGYQDVCARDARGDVWCWGCNHVGVIGDGGREGRAEPTRVPL